VLLVSALLADELREVLRRPKLRRWLTSEDAEAFVEGVELLAEAVPDPPPDACAGACRDPDDDCLVALAEAHGATLFVRGDKDLLEVDRPGLDVRTPRDALDAVLYEHPWGPALIPTDARSAWEAARAAGDAGVLETTAAFVTALREREIRDLLAHLVTPESLSVWQAELAEARALVAGRGMATGVDYPVDGVAHVKLPPDPATSCGRPATCCWPALSSSRCNSAWSCPTCSGWVAGGSTGSVITCGSKLFRQWPVRVTRDRGQCPSGSTGWVAELAPFGTTAPARPALPRR
jgi:putative PIN family toxin of toxin-antitoxin system